jgi:hypothetical protein
VFGLGIAVGGRKNNLLVVSELKLPGMIHRGATRTVLRVGPLAFKFGRGDEGARCNRHEADLYSRNRSKPHRKKMLCPVLWCSRSGKLLIARRAASPIAKVDLGYLKAGFRAASEWNYLGPPDDDHPFEWKPSDWGYLSGRIVAVDYATTANDDFKAEST